MEAFIAAQADMEQPKKTATNPHFKSKFAPLDECIGVSVPVLNAHGVALSQPTVSDGDRIGVRTVIMGYGEQMELGVLMGTPPSDPQKIGSWLTYFRRYALNAALAQAAEEDDDGNVASASQGDAIGSDAPIVRAIYGKKKALDMTDDQLTAAIKRDFGKEHPGDLTMTEAKALADKMQKALDAKGDDQ